MTGVQTCALPICGEVSLYDMTSAYSVFANEGIRNAPYVIEKVTDANGNILEEHTPDPQRVLPQTDRKSVV